MVELLVSLIRSEMKLLTSAGSMTSSSPGRVLDSGQGHGSTTTPRLDLGVLEAKAARARHS